MMHTYHIEYNDSDGIFTEVEICADKLELIDGALVFYELLEGDGNYEIFRIMASGIWLEVNRQLE